MNIEIHPSRTYSAGAFVLCLVGIIKAWGQLTQIVVRPGFYEQVVPDVLPVFLILICVILLPICVLHLRRTFLASPAVAANRKEVIFDCSFLGPTRILWHEVTSLKIMEGVLTRSLALEISREAFDKLDFWQRFILVMGFGGDGQHVYLPETAYPGTAEDLLDKLLVLQDS